MATRSWRCRSTAWPAQAEAARGRRAAQFYIPATTSLQERRPRDAEARRHVRGVRPPRRCDRRSGRHGRLYYRDTRYLSWCQSSDHWGPPLLLGSTLRDDNATLTCDLTNPDIATAPRHRPLEHDLIHIRRSCFLWNATCYQRLSIRNFDQMPARSPHPVRLRRRFRRHLRSTWHPAGKARHDACAETGQRARRPWPTLVSTANGGNRTRLRPGADAADIRAGRFRDRLKPIDRQSVRGDPRATRQPRSRGRRAPLPACHARCTPGLRRSSAARHRDHHFQRHLQ